MLALGAGPLEKRSSYLSSLHSEFLLRNSWAGTEQKKEEEEEEEEDGLMIDF